MGKFWVVIFFFLLLTVCTMGCMQKQVAVTTQVQTGGIVITNQGGKDIDQVNRFDITINSLPSSVFLDKKAGSSVTIPADPGIHHVVISAQFNDKSTQKLLDANVTVKETADYWYKNGKREEDAKKYAEAIVNYDKALAVDSRHKDSLWSKGYCLSQMGQWNKALTNDDIATNLYPNDAILWNNKGTVLFNLERYDDALSVYVKALKLDPKYEVARSNIKITSDKMLTLPAGKNEKVKVFNLGSSTLRVTSTETSPPGTSPSGNEQYRFSYEVRLTELGGNTFTLTNRSSYVKDDSGDIWTTWGLPVTKDPFDHSIPAYGSYTDKSWYQSLKTNCHFCGGKIYLTYYGHDARNKQFEIPIEINLGG
jgi:tetratricopeptide (TPR) repeat protein